jgi:hypothetical protein
MLNKIILINSASYSKAVLNLNVDSLQLVGPNNVGKSSLINALNFLFIVDGNKMQFSGDRSFQTSIHFYFPSHNKSYIIFSITKNGSYCLVLRRTPDKQLEYFKVDHEYTEELFIKKGKKGDAIIDFDNFLDSLESQGIKYRQMETREEVFQLVYQRDINSQGVIWLKDTIKSRGLSNSFTKIYMNLFNPKLIKSDTLKDALVIADNRENDYVSFSERDKYNLLELDKLKSQIDKISSIKSDFNLFKQVFEKYQEKYNKTGELYYEFLEKHNKEIESLDEQTHDLEAEINRLHSHINDELNPEKDKLLIQIGSQKSELKNKTEIFERTYKEFKETSSYEPLDFLNEQYNNLSKPKADIEFRLQTVARQKTTSQEVTEEISNLREKIEGLARDIENYDNLLINNITTNENVKTLVNSVLSREVLRLPKERIQKIVSKADDLLKIFDGQIDITEIRKETVEGVDKFTKQLDAAKAKLHEEEEMLKVMLEKEDFEKQIQDIDSKLAEITRKKEKISNQDNLQRQMDALEEEISILTNKLIPESEKKLTRFRKETTDLEQLINKRNEQKIELTNRKRELIVWYNEVKEDNLSPIVGKIGDDKIDSVYRKLKNENRDKQELKTTKDEAFMNLKLKLDNNIASEREFIKFVDDEISTIADKEKAIDTLLQSVANDFSIPTLELLNKFNDFKEFVKRFNIHLSNYTVSNIEKISITVADNERLLNDLRKIGSIQAIPKDLLLLNFNKPDNIIILDRYLKYSRKVDFREMFELIVEIQKGGKKERVDISKQIESDGTDRMIKLFIFLTLIKWMVVDDPANKIVIYIDEGGQFGNINRKEIIRFCKENNIVPIFAAPDGVVLPDIEKYYFLLPDAAGKVIVNETRAINAKATA